MRRSIAPGPRAPHRDVPRVLRVRLGAHDPLGGAGGHVARARAADTASPRPGRPRLIEARGLGLRRGIGPARELGPRRDAVRRVVVARGGLVPRPHGKARGLAAARGHPLALAAQTILPRGAPRLCLGRGDHPQRALAGLVRRLEAIDARARRLDPIVTAARARRRRRGGRRGGGRGLGARRGRSEGRRCRGRRRRRRRRRSGGRRGRSAASEGRGRACEGDRDEAGVHVATVARGTAETHATERRAAPRT